jgi:hypothetical protein
MAAPKASHAQLDAQPFGGLVREDVMDKIWDISNVPLPFTDLCSKGTHTNRRVEFVENVLATQVSSNALVEGADVSQDNTKLGTRIGNYTQIAGKEIKVTDTAENANSIGNQGTIAGQVKDRQIELRRDVEAQMLTHQASVAGDADTTAGISGGLGAQLKTNVSVGATGSVGGFNTTTGLFAAPTPGTPRALSETTLRDILQSIYENGGNTSVIMARPVVIRKLSEYLFSSTARVATMTSEKEQQSGPGPLIAYGSVNVFVTDFGQTLQLKDNRMQLADTTGVSSVYLLDSAHLRQSFLRGYMVEPLAKTGLSEKRLMSCQYSLLVLNERSQGALLAIDETAAVVA